MAPFPDAEMDAEGSDEEGSTGSSTVRSRRRRVQDEECRTHQQLFRQHSIQQLFYGRRHDLDLDVGSDSDSTSRGDSSPEEAAGGTGAGGESRRFAEDLWQSLVIRRRESATRATSGYDSVGPIGLSLSCRPVNLKDNADESMISSLMDSVASFDDGPGGRFAGITRNGEGRGKSSKDTKKNSKRSSSDEKEGWRKQGRRRGDGDKEKEHNKLTKSQWRHDQVEQDRRGSKLAAYTSKNEVSSDESDLVFASRHQPRDVASDRGLDHEMSRLWKLTSQCSGAKDEDGVSQVSNRGFNRDSSLGRRNPAEEYKNDFDDGNEASDDKFARGTSRGDHDDVPLESQPRRQFGRFRRGRRPVNQLRRSMNDSVDQRRAWQSKERRCLSSCRHKSFGPSGARSQGSGAEDEDGAIKREFYRDSSLCRQNPAEEYKNDHNDGNEVVHSEFTRGTSHDRRNTIAECNGAHGDEERPLEAQPRRQFERLRRGRRPANELRRSMNDFVDEKRARQSKERPQLSSHRHQSFRNPPVGMNGEPNRSTSGSTRRTARDGRARLSKSYVAPKRGVAEDETRCCRPGPSPNSSTEDFCKGQIEEAKIELTPSSPSGLGEVNDQVGCERKPSEEDVSRQSSGSTQRDTSTHIDAECTQPISKAEVSVIQGNADNPLRNSFQASADRKVPFPEKEGKNITQPARRTSTYSTFEESLESDDFPLFRGKGGNKYNWEGTFRSFEDRLYKKKLPGASANLEGGTISKKALMEFVMSESAGSAQSSDSGDSKRHYLVQVSRLGICQDDGEISDEDLRPDDPKFAVCREVVESYVDGESERARRGKLAVEEHRSLVEGTKTRRGDHWRKLHVYKLGDEGRRCDMVKDDDKVVALVRIARLRPGDHAFVRRTTGRWTYARVERASPDSILFAVNSRESSKAYNVKYWVSHIRAARVPLGAPDDGGSSDGRDAFARRRSESRFSVTNLSSVRNLATPSDGGDGA